MKLTISWLRDHLDTTATVGGIADALTDLGLEVEGVHDPAAALRPFTVARVLDDNLRTRDIAPAGANAVGTAEMGDAVLNAFRALLR